MPNDMITLKALGKELSETLNSGRINRIASLGNDSYLFTVRARGTNRALFLSAKSDTAGVYITESEHSADEIPNNFCMALRKRLIGGIMESFSVENEDRIIKILMSPKNLRKTVTFSHESYLRLPLDCLRLPCTGYISLSFLSSAMKNLYWNAIG